MTSCILGREGLKEPYVSKAKLYWVNYLTERCKGFKINACVSSFMAYPKTKPRYQKLGQACVRRQILMASRK